MAAAYLATFNKDIDVTLIESPSIPIIGVGESVSPHFVDFLNMLGVPEYEWMPKIGAVHKLGNKFTNWTLNQGESVYFGFTYPIPEDRFLHDVYQPRSILNFRPKSQQRQTQSYDHLGEMLRTKVIDRLDRFSQSHYHYMNKNVSFMQDGQSLFSSPWNHSHHINAEKIGAFIRDQIAIPLGVNHIVSTVVKINHDGDTVESVTLDNGYQIEADVFVDATGLSGMLINQLGWAKKQYNYPIDRVWVCQTNYKDPAIEMLNHTHSIAEPNGWRFQIGLYHRMGNGYCFSSKHTDELSALDYFKTQLTNDIRSGPRLIRWTPQRLENAAAGNVISIGMSNGFIEPMESNVVFTTINAIKSLSKILKTNTLNWHKHNSMMSSMFDNIYEFLLVHFTLTQRTDTDFWKYCSNLGKQLNHTDLVKDKMYNKDYSFFKSLGGHIFYADFVWAGLSAGWKLSLETKLDSNLHELVRHTILYNEKKHDLVSDNMPNYYEWLRLNLYQGYNPNEWEKALC